MTTTPYDSGDNPVAPDPLAPAELDDQKPDTAEPLPDTKELDLDADES